MTGGWETVGLIGIYACIHGMAQQWREGTESGRSFTKWCQNWRVSWWQGILWSFAAFFGMVGGIFLLAWVLRGCPIYGLS